MVGIWTEMILLPASTYLSNCCKTLFYFSLNSIPNFVQIEQRFKEKGTSAVKYDLIVYQTGIFLDDSIKPKLED